MSDRTHPDLTVKASSLAAHPAADLFPRLGFDELQQLADDIAKRGLIETVWLYDDPERGTVVLDGRNRIAACEIAGIEPTIRYYEGDDPIGFVVAENVRRRHLSAGQLAMLMLDVEALEAAEAGKRTGGRPRKNVEKLGADRHQVSAFQRRAVSRAGEKVGVSGRAVARAKRVATKAPDLAVKVKSGQMAIDRADRIVRDREAATRRAEEAQQQANQQPVVATVDIRLGDFRTTLTDLHDIDAIITDPPYPKEYLPLLNDLAKWADTVLAKDGVLAVLMGQTHLPEVYQRLAGYRPYRWTVCYLTEGPGYVSHPRQIQSNWKPLLIYGGGPRTSDIVRSVGSDADAKDRHHWGQDYGAFFTIIERLTKPGQTVADPFMGSGTTLLAAHALGRHAVGCDIDPEAVKTAQEWLNG